MCSTRAPCFVGTGCSPQLLLARWRWHCVAQEGLKTEGQFHEGSPLVHPTTANSWPTAGGHCGRRHPSTNVVQPWRCAIGWAWQWLCQLCPQVVCHSASQARHNCGHCVGAITHERIGWLLPNVADKHYTTRCMPYRQCTKAWAALRWASAVMATGNSPLCCRHVSHESGSPSPGTSCAITTPGIHSSQRPTHRAHIPWSQLPH